MSLALRTCLLATLLFALTAPIFAQGTAADYQRMQQLGRMTGGKVFRDEVTPNWLPGGDHFWYRVRTGSGEHEFVFVDATKGLREPAFDHGKLAQQLSDQLKREVAPTRLPFERIQFSKDFERIIFNVSGDTFQVDRGDQSLTRLDQPAEALVSSIPAFRRPYPSTDKGGEILLKVVNETTDTVKLFWIDRDGRPVFYNDIAAQKEHERRTFVGHVWLVLNSRDQALAVYEAIDPISVLKVDGKNARELPRRRRRDGRPRSGRTSPDGQWTASIENHNLVIRQEKSGEPIRLTTDGTADKYLDDRFYWSPDSKRLIVMEVTPGQGREVTFVESSPEDQLQPKVHTFSYDKPGDKIRQQWPRLFDLEKIEELLLDRSLFENPFAISEASWQTDSSEFRFLYNQRGHQAIRVVAIDRDAAVRTVVEETSETFVDYTNKVYYNPEHDQNEIVWMSERTGWNHLYLVDAAKGEVLHPITSGEWVVREIERVDRDKKQIWFTAGGIVSGQDPYFLHHCRVNFDGSGLTVLTEGDGTHMINFSPEGRYMIDEYSRVDLPPVHTLRRTDDGSLVCELEQADASQLLETGWKMTERFAAKGRDGETDIYGVLYFPTNFDPAKKYPVIEYIYAGPHSAFVPKRFSMLDQQRELAELGFIVVLIDGMGTNHRGKAFHDVCWKNLSDSGFPDRIAWMKAAAEKFPSMDLSRVGIYGGSAGGQSALAALLWHGDFYDVAVADCGCHDNRMDKIWWNEQWMGWPVDDSYAQNSNVTHAHKLQGDLFLIVGEMDTNVDPASTMQVVNALVKADKDFDLLVVPGEGHGIGSGRYGMRRTRDFFVRKLYGVEPRR
ncbi:Prolyl tripeptidyl peptidase precursor [Bremerella volcania]|uniref:Prolyl tripeptidyl peptidase n=1 Tax=Bremerella volcania TaxID=2527984 RepID=A0A518CG69_9BACT|nr:prolyl oligopeptidase family serine peptidase [Bremerella volcania]QDU78221.1 Prolyl tripeptidyl peptidase precursor [Bremerella volcania]